MHKALPILVVAACCVAFVLLTSSHTDEAVELESTETTELAAQGYVNWLRWTSGLKGGKKGASKEFEDDAGPQMPSYGNLDRAGKMLLRLRNTISNEKRILTRLDNLMKNRRGGKKQPESIVVHVGQVGERGHRGKMGGEGARGKPGRRGATGAPGAPGEPGRKGETGPVGDVGPMGRIGAKGRRGRQGRTGPRGEDGPDGPQGPAGPQGYPGLPGPPGLQGRNGNEGPEGLQGPPGVGGAMGPNGPPGPPGRMILPRPEAPTFNLGGLVRNAVDGAAINQGTVTAVVGDRIVSTSPITNGNYQLTRLATGTYQIRVSANGFCDYQQELAIGTQHATYNINMSPTLQGLQLRIVLTWGAEPRDLDSHLRSPNNCLTYYANRNGCAGVSLDRDVTNGFGPETMTIHVPQPGLYLYRVHNYSRTNANLMVNGLANQPATVTVYKGCERTTYVCGRDGNVVQATQFWDVFNYNGATGVLTRASA